MSSTPLGSRRRTPLRCYQCGCQSIHPVLRQTTFVLNTTGESTRNATQMLPVWMPVSQPRRQAHPGDVHRFFLCCRWSKANADTTSEAGVEANPHAIRERIGSTDRGHHFHPVFDAVNTTGVGLRRTRIPQTSVDAIPQPEGKARSTEHLLRTRGHVRATPAEGRSPPNRTSRPSHASEFIMDPDGG